MYVQGLSTSLPEDVQLAMIHTIAGMEHAQIMRSAYAIEYDCIDSTTLQLSLQSKEIAGLFFAGQIYGTSGYEGVAAEGLVGGLYASLFLRGQPPLILDRSEGYIGVLIDDLVTKGTNEPYRMMTSRAEYRLLLRQDNADLRLTGKGFEAGLVTQERYERMLRKREALEREMARLKTVNPLRPAMVRMLEGKGEAAPQSGVKLYDLLRRTSVSYADLLPCDPDPQELPPEVAEQVEIEARYEGYIAKQAEEVAHFKGLEGKLLPQDMDYLSITGLRIEARQKLNDRRPVNIGQASRISGVSPADIAVLLVYLEKLRREEEQAHA